MDENWRLWRRYRTSRDQSELKNKRGVGAVATRGVFVSKEDTLGHVCVYVFVVRKCHTTKTTKTSFLPLIERL